MSQQMLKQYLIFRYINTNICHVCSVRFSHHSISKWAIKEFPSLRLQHTNSGTEYTKTVDHEEVNKFSALSSSWWDEGGTLKALHTLNELRIPMIRDCLLKQVVNDQQQDRRYKPLSGLKILDVGCGGGLLSEPLARLGAQVTGIDASKENIEAAAWHATLDNHIKDRIRYLALPVEDIAHEEHEKYDGVIASEIIEHVSNPEKFVAACCDLVKPGGSFFLTTLNKTWISWALAIIAAERILKIVPAGAHDWNKFVSSDDLINMLSKNNFDVRLIHGMTMNPLTLRWRWITDTSINYAVHASKPVTSDSDTDNSSSNSDSD